MPPPTTIAKYIQQIPEAARAQFAELREVVRQGLPQASEHISYGILAYKGVGPIVYISGNKKHVALYPAPRSHPQFAEVLSAYKGGKGTVQFPLDVPLPRALIAQIVEHLLVHDNERLQKKNG